MSTSDWISAMIDRGWRVVVALTVVLVVGLLLLMAACGSSPSLETGKVIEKEYDDPDDTYYPGYTTPGRQSCTGTGTSRFCTYQPGVYIPGHWDHDPERFLLHLRGPHPEDADKSLDDTIEVPEWFFDKVREGQWVDVDALEIIPR